MSLGVKNSSKELKNEQEMKVNKYMIVFFFGLLSLSTSVTAYQNQQHVIMNQYKNN